MLDQLTIYRDPDDVKTLQKILNDVHNQALGTAFYNTTNVSLADIPVGKLVVIDDGTSTRGGIRTGKDRMAWWSTNSATGTVLMTSNTIMIVQSSSGTKDTYWTYNSATHYLECWVDGVKRMEI
jgi:hypothetical protein